MLHNILIDPIAFLLFRSISINSGRSDDRICSKYNIIDNVLLFSFRTLAKFLRQ